MWKQFKEWLLQYELKRERQVLREILSYERAKIEKDWYERREQLESQYAMIKRQNEHLTNLLLEHDMLDPNPKQIIIKPLNN